MTNKFYQLKSIVMLAIVALSFSSCLKSNDATFTDFSTVGSNVTLMTTAPSTAGGILFATGITGFKLGNVDPTAGDSVDLELVAQVNSEYPLSSDVTVTLAVDDAKRTAYNAAQTPNTNYLAMLPTMYKMLSTSLTIPAGQRLARTKVRIYNIPIRALPASSSWMLPITLSASGLTVASNSSTLYVNVIGNPLAGSYSVVGTRYNYTGFATYSGPPAPIPTPVSTTAIPSPKAALPIDGQTITMSFSNLGFGTGFEYGYLITGNATFSAISVGYNNDFSVANSRVNSYLVAGSYVPPTATQKAKFRIITHYNNNATGTGNDRIIDESFTQL